ncbi:uncharacterized protein LOC111342729 isoform X1 [Stylophora pistillata]|uniref:uncharacterized protein LOC111342729 isoform X1 n=1 Tax=Stylophora pistillata TaxID=50429 RepID=UPI000C040424|nr:uncharacterized protein LOC111342729 isoform X1 [Stylophora pistillata]
MISACLVILPKQLLSEVMKVLVCITLVALLCCTTEGWRKKKLNVRTVSQAGESCQLPNGFPWGNCYKTVNCPAAPHLNCAEGLRCCSGSGTGDDSADDTRTEVQDTAYDKFLRDMGKYYS